MIDAPAAFPVNLSLVITGLSTGFDWDAYGDFAGAHLRARVATAGDVNGDGYSDTIVGAPDYDAAVPGRGLVNIYYGSQYGPSTDEDWTKLGLQLDERFGNSVATAGDVNGDGYSDVLIASPLWQNDAGQTDEGAVWIYMGGEGGLSTSDCARLEGNQAGVQFGWSLGSAGDVNHDGNSEIFIGAPYYDNGSVDEGMLWIYPGSATCVATSPNWHAESNQANAWLGLSASLAGSVNGDIYADLIVGAPDYNNGSSKEGMAFIWFGAASGMNAGVDGTPGNADWSAESNQADAEYGWSVATAGDVNGDGFADVITGSPYYNNGQNDEGATFTYHGSATGPSPSYDNMDEGNVEDALFGWSVATAGDVNGDGYADVVVGAPEMSAGQTREGQAWLWHGGPNGIAGGNDWNVQGNLNNAWYGKSVATAGDVNGDGYSDVIVGSPGYTDGQVEEGAAFLYYGGPDSLSQSAGWSKRSNEADSDFGFALASAGDVNGDGFADVIVGAPDWDTSLAAQGGAFVYLGDEDGLQTSPQWSYISPTANGRLGYSVDGAGDVNHDGYDDVIVGAPYWSNHAEDPEEGGIFLFPGSAGGVLDDYTWAKDSDQDYAHFGWSVSGAGDVNGDGFADIIAGAPGYESGGSDLGAAFVYHGWWGVPRTTPAWHAYGEHSLDQTGTSVAGAGDVDRDGYADVVVGSPGYDNGELNEGNVRTYHGSAQGLEVTYYFHVESDQDLAAMGSIVNAAGDINRDGFSDIILGVPLWDGGLTDEGVVWVYIGSSAGVTSTFAWNKESNKAQARFGSAAAGAGDVNGDGYADIIVGADHWEDAAESDEGAAWVYHGGPTGVISAPAWYHPSGQAGALFGKAVAGAGDVNGDGYADVLVGADEYTDLVSHEGGVFLYYGNGHKGLSLGLKQQVTSGTQTISHEGQSNSPTAFRLRVTPLSPFGNGELWVENEVRKLGAVFSIFTHSWTAEYRTSKLMHFGELSPATPYHWRTRVRYELSSLPYQPHGRWVTMPWGSWSEAMLVTPPVQMYLPVGYK